MPSLSGSVQVFGQELWSSSSTPAHQVGAAGLGSDGRVYRYAKAGIADLVVGNVLQARATNANHREISVRNTPAWASYANLTTYGGPGALTVNEYAGGSLLVDTGTTGLGYSYKIAGHAAVAGTADGRIDLDRDVLQAALVLGTHTVTLAPQPYSGVIQHPAAATGICVGVCIYPILANQYGWVQSGGPGAALCAGTIGIGQPATSVGTAGSLTVHTAELNVVATMLSVGAAGKICAVWLCID
jgi:hypothetical protein